MGRKKRQKHLLQPFLQVHHDEGHGNDGLAGSGALGHDPGKAEATLALAELAFNRDAIQLVLVAQARLLVQFGGIVRSFLHRPPQGRSGHPDAMLFAELAVVAAAVDLVAMNRFRIVPKAPPECFDLGDQVTRFIVEIPVKTVEKGRSVHQAGG